MNARRRIRALFRRTRSAPPAPASAFRLAQREPARSPLGQRIIEVARGETPSDADRQRILDGVLAALRQLTSGAA